MRNGRVALVSLTLGIALCSPGASGDRLFGPTKPEEYLTGRFVPRSHPNFVRVDRLGIPADREMYIRRDAGEALARMYRDFRKAHPKSPFRIVSAARNFEAQRAIWDGKWTGRIKVDGVSLARAVPEPVARGRRILRFSSMPGTSRHHWGTDVDITSLENRYFESGPGKQLLTWLEKNAGRYGFCRPYSAGRSEGYHEERWHWSYRPASAPLLAEWSKRFGADPKNSLRFAAFQGAESMRALAPTYVESVSDDCR